MAEFKTPEKSSIMMPTSLYSSGSSSSSSAVAFDDDDDLNVDSCSICLEPFCLNDPATGTSCKHEYHLHCILEWSQRSKECPICWQSLTLKDPASQELLAAVEIERNARGRRVPSRGSTNAYQQQESDLEYASYWTDDPDFNERIMRHLTAMMSRARQAHRSEGRRSEGSSSPVLTFPSFLSESIMHPNTPEECSSAYGSSGGSSPSPSISSVDVQPPLSPSPSFVSLSSASAPRRTIHQPSRTLESPSPDSTQKPRSSELLGFSDSIKSKLSAASARYKDSISKGTQGFREKLLARNTSVKEMSKGVQREMSASLAGVTRMIEKLDLKTKRNPESPEGAGRVGETSNLFSKGKGVLDHLIASSRENRVQADQAVGFHEKSQANGSISGC